MEALSQNGLSQNGYGNLAPDLCIIEMMRQVNIRLLLLLYMKLR